MLDYDALHCLSEVLRYGSFDKGAQALHLTQSAVSQKIKRLELNLGKSELVIPAGGANTDFQALFPRQLLVDTEGRNGGTVSGDTGGHLDIGSLQYY